MAEGKVGSTGFLSGVRFEKTDTESRGWVRARTVSTAAQQVADPVGSAQRDYASTRRELEGSYTKSFPSVHLNHDFTRNLKARLSWSTSFGRPSLANLLPNETVNENAQTLTINNPSLLPQTATNWDASLQYYFEPAGTTGMVFFQFMDDDFERGMQTKKKIERIFYMTQIIVYCLIAFTIVFMAASEWRYKSAVAFIVLILWLTRLLNPITYNYNLYKAQKQSIFGGGPTKDTEDEIETFDTGAPPP